MNSKHAALVSIMVLFVLLACSCNQEQRSYVYFDPNGGTIQDGRTYIQVDENGIVREPSVSKPYNEFLGWYSSPEFDGAMWNFETDAVAKKTNSVHCLYAKWLPFFRLSESGSIKPNSDASALFGALVNIPETLGNETVKRIAFKAFKDNTAIESVKLPSSIESIGSRCFMGCTRLSVIEFDGTSDQWDAISKGESWSEGIASNAVVKCEGDKTTIELN